MSKRQRRTLLCKQCGISFHSSSSRTVFCSRKCYDIHRTESRALCLNCGTRVKGGGATGGYKYCSHACRVEHKKPHARPCINCKTIFTPIKYNTSAGRIVAYNAGKTCSTRCQLEWISRNEERKAKISKAFTGANHPNWEGGKTALNVTTHRGSKWLAIAEKVRKRDKYICRICGKTQEANGRKLDVHHIKAYHDINDAAKANKPSNLLTLCKSCHRKEDAKIKHKQIILPFAAIAREGRQRQKPRR